MTTPPTIDVVPLIESGLVDDARWLAEATSTNSLLLSEPLFPNDAGTYLLGADTQTAGRGRNANRWHTTPGALTFSLLLRAIAIPDLLAFRAALSICAAVDDLLPQATEIKWPNDVLFQGKKLAGILIEQRPGVGTVVGIGINVNNRTDESDPAIRSQMTSLADHSADVVSRSSVLKSVLECWRENFAVDVHAVRDAFVSRDALKGRDVVVLDGPDGDVRQRGIAEGLDVDGGLLIDVDGVRTVVHSGSVRLA